jgi:hypothetical protein
MRTIGKNILHDYSFYKDKGSKNCTYKHTEKEKSFYSPKVIIFLYICSTQKLSIQKQRSC